MLQHFQKLKVEYGLVSLILAYVLFFPIYKAQQSAIQPFFDFDTMFFSLIGISFTLAMLAYLLVSWNKSGKAEFAGPVLYLIVVMCVGTWMSSRDFYAENFEFLFEERKKIVAALLNKELAADERGEIYFSAGKHLIYVNELEGGLKIRFPTGEGGIDCNFYYVYTNDSAEMARLKPYLEHIENEKIKARLETEKGWYQERICVD